MTKPISRQRRPTGKFEQRRTAILDVASAHINAFGVRGMTLTGVAAELALDTSSVTYYFRKKDDLAAACLERTLERQNEAARQAAAESIPISAIRSFLHAHLEVCRADRPREAPCMALLSDMNSMSEDRRAPLHARYAETVRLLRTCFDRELSPERTLLAAQAVMGVANWLPGWIFTYADADYERVEDRLVAILTDGIGAGGSWRLDGRLPDESEDNAASARFLRAATSRINENGYHGASVERIAADLGVSTGSFYHHLENKDELVLACFQRSYAVIARASALGDQAGGPAGQRLATSLSSLVRLQFGATSPLLRSSAFQALPPHLRERMLLRTAQVTHHFAGVIADGVVDGSIRPTDPLLAGHVLISLINAADDLRGWADGRDIDQAVELFARTFERGLLKFGSG